MGIKERVQAHRKRMREMGYRPIQIWVPDVRSQEFAAEARRQSLLVAGRDATHDDQEFVEAITIEWENE